MSPVQLLEDPTNRVFNFNTRFLIFFCASIIVAATVANATPLERLATLSDATIRKGLAEQLAFDDVLHLRDVSLEVKEGIALLSGTVASLFEKERAVALAEVDSSRLEVDSDAASEARRQRKYTVPRRGQITSAVRDALNYDPRVDSRGIAVHLEAGVIQLDGQVNTLTAKRAAEQDALRTRYVSGVDNRLVVVAASKGQETKAESSVKAALARDIYVADDNIEVSVNDGIARMFGTTNSKTGKQRAETIAESVAGITSIANELKVVADSKPPTDLQIKYGVKNRLFWSSFVDDREVSVVVDDGQVTLTGTVDDRAAFHEATQAAIEAGASEVDNRLIVRELAIE